MAKETELFSKNSPLGAPENQERVRKLIQEHLLSKPPEIRKTLPTILQRPKGAYMVYATDTYFMLTFINRKEQQRTDGLVKDNLHPYPGLIAERPSDKVAFKLEGSRNTYLDGNTVENMFAVHVGKDVSAILRNHRQRVNIAELGPYEYVIELAYILSFGDEITPKNVYGHLEKLLTYSVKLWELQNGN